MLILFEYNAINFQITPLIFMIDGICIKIDNIFYQQYELYVTYFSIPQANVGDATPFTKQE